MALKSQHTFQKMDSDTADRYLSEGKYRSALNIHIGSSENSEMLSVENVKGNTLVSYSLPSGTNKVIGSHEDIKNKVVYYFLCNESSINISSTSGSTVVTSSAHGLAFTDLVNISGISGRTDILGKWIVKPINTTTFEVLNPLTYTVASLNSISLTGSSGASGTITRYSHSVLKYDSITGTISLVYSHSRLNFNSSYPVTGTALLSNVLHWTDGYNPPRSIDLSRCSTYGTFFVDPMIDFIRIPPTTPCTAVSSWVNSSGTPVSYIGNENNNNWMQNKAYQFRYKYVYMDDTQSVWSPVSITIPTGFIDDKKNKIVITINNNETANYTYYSKVIKSIEVSFRNSPIAPFRLIKIIPFPTAIGFVTLSFFNDIASYAIDAAETNKISDAVPKVTNSLAAVKNRIFQGGCLEGFNVDPTAFSASALTYTVPAARNSITYKTASTYEIGIEFIDRAGRRSGVYNLIRASIPRRVSNTRTPTFLLSGRPPIWATHYQIVRTASLNKSFFIQGYAQLGKRKDFKTEFIFNGLNGILNYSPQEGDYLAVVSPTTFGDAYVLPIPRKVLGVGANEETGQGTIIVEGDATEASQLGQYFLVEIYTQSKVIDGLYYEVGYKRDIKDPGTDKRSFFSTGATSGTINMNDVITGDIYLRRLNDSIVYHSRTSIVVEQIGGTIVPGTTYTFVLGIDNTIFTTDVTSTTAVNDIANDLISKINKSSYYRAYKIPTFTTGGPFSNFLVYDIRPGITGLITVTQSLNLDGAVTGGVWESPGTNVTPVEAQTFMNSYVESMSNNDEDLTWDKNIGRPNIVLQYGDKEVNREDLIRFGGIYISGTAINNVNSYASLDQEQLSNNGPIRKLITAANNQAEGTVLLGVQDNDISSIYVGQSVLTNAGGGQNISATDKVIGTVNSLQKLVGTVNPESVVQHNGTIYGFDALRGIVWRYGQDGLTFISEETGGGQPGGMKNFFYKASKYLLSLGSFKCYAGIDPYSNEYILTIPSSNSAESTVVWSETINGWTSFMSFIGEWYQKINTRFISFKSGQLWLHQNNPLYNNFYGVQYESNVRFILNKEPFDSKILQVVEEIAKGSQWDCSDISTPDGQSSELIGLYDISSPNTYPADFTQYENRYSANVMRDKNTPNLQSSDYPLLNGDEMRSDVFSILLRNNQTSQQNLYGVNLYYVPSYKSM